MRAHKTIGSNVHCHSRNMVRDMYYIVQVKKRRVYAHFPEYRPARYLLSWNRTVIKASVALRLYPTTRRPSNRGTSKNTPNGCRR